MQTSIPETASMSVIGADESPVTTANTAGNNYGHVGNKTTNNIYLSVPEHRSSVRIDVASDHGSLQVEYRRSSHAESSEGQNEIATKREATAAGKDSVEAERQQDDTVDIGIDFRDDDFAEPEALGVTLRKPGETKKSSNSTLSGDQRNDCLDEEDEKDWEFVDIGDITETSDSSDISRRYCQKHKADTKSVHSPGFKRTVETHVIPSRNVQTKQCLLDEEDTDESCNEYALGRGLKKRRDSTISKITHGLLEIVNQVDVNLIEHLAQDIVFLLHNKPLKVEEIWQKLREIKLTVRNHDSACITSKTNRSDVSNEYKMFAIHLTDDLYDIRNPGLRHEAEQLIDDVICLGKMGVGELWEFEAFLKKLKFLSLD